MSTASTMAVMNAFRTAQRIGYNNSLRHHQLQQKRYRKKSDEVEEEKPVDTRTPEQKEIAELKQKLHNVGCFLQDFNEMSWFEKMRFKFHQNWIDYCLKS